MKLRILAGLCAALVADCYHVCADDTPAQAAARAALEQRFRHLDHPDAVSPNTNSMVAPAPSAGAVTSTAIAASNAPALPAASPTTSSNNPAAAAVSASVAPAENTTAQAAALVALKQRMNELNHAAPPPPLDTNFPKGAPMTATVAPVREAPAAASPVTETPAVEVPAARAPPIITAAAAPASVAPSVATPIPKASAAPAVVVVVPEATVVPLAVPGRPVLPATTPAAVAPAAPTLPSSSSGTARPINQLVTLTGKVYTNVEVERVTEDGIVISYAPAPGGWSMTKIAFQDLPEEVRKQYEKP